MFNKIALRLSQILLGLVAGLLLSEFLVRIWFPAEAEDRYFPWQPHLSAVFKPDPSIMPGTTSPTHFTINSQGIRGDELTGTTTYRILAIGGSTTECLYLDDAQTWTRQLQTDLNSAQQNVWVGNIGKSGLDTRHNIFHLQYFVPQMQKIDAVVILVGVNDMGHFALETAPEKTTEAIELSRAFWQIPRVDPPNDPFYKKTALWHLGRRIRYAWDQQQQPVRGFVQDTDGAVYTGLRARRQRAQIIDDLPDLTPMLKAYANNLNRLVDLAQPQFVRLIFMTQPSMWDPQMSASNAALLWQGVTEMPGALKGPADHPDRYYSIRALDRAMTQYNDVVLGVCRARNVECVDLARMLPRDTTVFYDDVHFNASGAKQVADTLARYLLQRAPFHP